jgi:hypothetical protein
MNGYRGTREKDHGIDATRKYLPVCNTPPPWMRVADLGRNGALCGSGTNVLRTRLCERLVKDMYWRRGAAKSRQKRGNG